MTSRWSTLVRPLQQATSMHRALGLLACLLVTSATAGTYTGVRPCTGTAGALAVDATSKRTIGVATCKTELQKKLAREGACTGRRRGERLSFSYKFGGDGEPDQIRGTGTLTCP